MSDLQEPVPDDERPFSAEDERLFAVLNQYLELIHLGEVITRSQMLLAHPELAGLIGTLEELDSLALPRSPRNDASTIMLTGEPGEPPKSAGSSEFVQPRFVEGQLFGKYELLCEVGRGGMGVVYKARQTDLNRVVALKMILSNHLASQDQVRRFYDEARAAGSLKHSHIVGIHEVGELSGQHYFAMDYVEGISLADKLQGNPRPFEESATCLSKIAKAVGYLHRHRIIHRDLKPSNILLDENCEPYVTDFGLAKIFSDESRVTRTGTIVGTPSYMAPEQAAGKISEISPRSDVYSLGAILYELLTGRPPFKENTPLDTLVQVLEGEPELPRKLNPEIPRGLELICLKCLEKRPEDRYQSADDLAADLERFLKSDPLEARSASFEHRVKRWARRSPALAARLAGLVIASMIVQLTYHLWGADFNYHVQVMSIFAVWAALSLAFQWMLQFESISRWVAYAWAATDVVLLTWQLCIADPPRGPLLIGYPLLITACGMFFRVRMVLFMTALSVLSYGFLCYTYPNDECQRPQYPIIFASVLTITGLVVAYQVYRVRALSRYYESRR